MNKSILNNLSLTRPVVLIGMMGAGKTSVGRALAELLSVPFFDSDEEIESETGRSVAQIFSAGGEALFRRLERQVVTRLLGGGVCVLSLGGGAFMDEQTRQQIKNKAFSVWLKVDKKILMERVLKTGSRPLLQCENPGEKVEKILVAREPVYAEADLAVRCDARPVLENAQMVMAALRAAL
ncbi:MAG: shikimate kinase [Bdellovibrionales bacterium]|jgi:shikimate kinase